jgi:hypothetical protein
MHKKGKAGQAGQVCWLAAKLDGHHPALPLQHSTGLSGTFMQPCHTAGPPAHCPAPGQHVQAGAYTVLLLLLLLLLLRHADGIDVRVCQLM